MSQLVVLLALLYLAHDARRGWNALARWLNQHHADTLAARDPNPGGQGHPPLETP